ncbi:MAG: hypothetical protein IJ789_03845 [Bacteroidales bacterium]|nr:hypothetical protein [Bacteroidales bacterium]
MLIRPQYDPNPSMLLSIYHLVCGLAVLSSAGAQMLLKKGATMGYEPLWRRYVNPWVIGGYAVMGVAMVVNIFCMSHGVKVKELGAIEALSYLFVPLLAWLLLGEAVSRRKAVAIALVVVGVVVFFL